MKSDLPKVLHTIGGRSLLGHAIAAARALDPVHLAVVVRHERDRVAAHIRECEPSCVIADQDEIKGTGRAVECGLDALPPGLAGTVVVTYGDVPLLSGTTLRDLVRAHEDGGYAATVATAYVPDPSGYGRIVREDDGSVARIVEHKDATDDELAITEINSGIYAFDGAQLHAALGKITTDNSQGEKYLTDVLAIERAAGLQVGAFVLADIWQCEGVNDKVQLARLGAELNRRTVEQVMRDGAIVIDPATTWIDAEVSVGTDTVIHPNSQLLGATTVGARATIGPDTTLRDMEVGDEAHLVRTHAALSVVGPGALVGPWVHLRPGTEIAADATVGSFVEMRNAQTDVGQHIGPLAVVTEDLIPSTTAGDRAPGQGSLS
jgi:bifunctional UDP-N-acetylglucosamine pyrophosphorylase/glucosamine-1-phosphate N-acetyltransferase